MNILNSELAHRGIMKLILSLLILVLLLNPIQQIQLYPEEGAFSTNQSKCHTNKHIIEYSLREIEHQAIMENNTFVLKLIKHIANYLLNTNLSCRELAIVENIIENIRLLLTLRTTTKAHDITTERIQILTMNKTTETYYAILDENELDNIIRGSPFYTRIANKHLNTVSKLYVNTSHTSYLGSLLKVYYPFKDINTTRIENSYNFNPYMLLLSFLSLTIIIILTATLFRPKIRI